MGHNSGRYYAGMAALHGEPHANIEALVKHQALPPVSGDAIAMRFGPGLDLLCRVAWPREIALWQRLTAPVPCTCLLCEG
jgi:hypothetical protein